MVVWGIIALIALVGLMQTIAWGEVQTALESSDQGWLVWAGVTIVVTQLLKTTRWYALLKAHQLYPSWWQLLKVHLIGQGLNTFMPIRIGEVARIQWLQPYDRAFVLSTITIEKGADLLCFIAMAVLLTLGTTLPPWLSEQFRFFAISSALIMVAIGALLVVSGKEWLTRIIGTVGVFRPLLSRYLRFREGWRQITRPMDALLLMVLSAAIWSMAILTNICLLAAFALPTTWVSATVLLVVLQIGITVVALPATIGIFEYLCMVTLGWFAVPESLAFSMGVVLHLLVLIPSMAGIWLARPTTMARESKQPLE
jgi:uncharacterized protein (TIRG00374 family)